LSPSFITKGFVVVQPGMAAQHGMVSIEAWICLTEEEYFEILESLPKENQMLDDKDPNKFIAKMGAEAFLILLTKINLDDLSFELRHQASNESSQQRKSEALKRLRVVEAFREGLKIRIIDLSG
jgi:DNA-directed RNA polymerase subunit beta'